MKITAVMLACLGLLAVSTAPSQTRPRWASAGDDSWGAMVHPEYRLPAKGYAYTFHLRPLKPGEDAGDVARAAK